MPLNEEQRSLRDLLTIKRSIYEMDEFVKMGQVRNICQEMLNAVFDKLHKSEVVARANKAQIEDNENKLKTV